MIPLSRQNAEAAAQYAPDPPIFSNRKADLMTTHVNELLDLEQVAEELHAPRLGVQRLIARGVLPANRLGASNVVRVQKADLISYIGNDCPDLETPKIDNERGWFAWYPAGRPNALARELIQLAIDGGQRLTDEYLERWRNSHHGENRLRVEIRVNEAMKSLWAAPLPEPLVRLKGRTPPPRIATTRGGELLAATLLEQLSRVIGRQPIRATITPTTKVQRLYESRDRYDELTHEAIRNILAGDLATRQEVRHVGILSAEIQVIYALGCGRFTSDAELRALANALL